jgi:hypothetical protein
MDRELVFSRMDTSIRASSDMACYTERALLNGQTILFTKENSRRMKLQAKALTNGLMEAHTKAKS